MANINLVAIAVACLAGFVVAVLVATVVCRRLLAGKEETDGDPVAELSAQEADAYEKIGDPLVDDFVRDAEQFDDLTIRGIIRLLLRPSMGVDLAASDIADLLVKAYNAQENKDE